jgi:nucleoid-associated protein YgaU
MAGNSPASLEPGTPPSGAAPKNYTVASGDSIARIAEIVYGSQAYYKVILEANPKVDPMKLRPGMVLVIPDVKETRGRGGHDDDSPAPAIESKAEYRVVAGDSLNKIAIKLYGKADRWEEIYDLNKDKIGTDPARLKLGMILKLPAPPTR